MTLSKKLLFSVGVLWVEPKVRAELAEEFLLLVAQVRRGAHFDVDLQVAAAVLAQEGDAFAADADDAAALGARGDLQR